jgi:cell division protein FtsZ
MRQAEAGINELQQYVDTLIVIPNQNLFRIANERTTFAEAFRLADEVLHCGVRGITDLMVMPGFMNLDFADVKTVMGEMGKAMMGTGEADGDDRAVRAAEAAISNPLLDDVSMKGARGVLINITGGLDMTLFEVDQAANRIREEVDPEAQIKVGSTLGEALDGRIRVSVIATGIDAAVPQRAAAASGAGMTARTTRPAPAAVKPQPQTAYAQPAYPQSFTAPVQQPHQTQQIQQPQQTQQSQQVEQAVSTVTQPPTYFTMPQTIVPHADVLPHAAKVETVEAEEEIEVNSRQQECERNFEKEEIAQPRSVDAEPLVQHVQASVAPQAKSPPDANRSTRPATPIAPNDMRMTQLAAHTAVHHQPPSDQRRQQRRAESLFTRITGFGLVRPSSSHHEDESHEPPSDELLAEPHLDVRPSDRPVLSDQPEDLLEIPAFLRRQSNH